MSINEIVNRKVKLFIFCTGAGSGFQDKLWNVPGCSTVLVGAGFPYDSKLTSKIIGYTPDKFVSAETSVELAMAAYMEAFDPEAKDYNTVGIGLSASVISSRVSKGDHKIFVTAINNNASITLSYTLRQGIGSNTDPLATQAWAQEHMKEGQREKDGAIADKLIELAISRLLDISYSANVSPIVSDASQMVKNQILARPFFKADGSKCTTKDFFGQTDNYNNYVFYPGSFNPLHHGHLFAAKQSYKTAVHLNDEIKELIFSTCINPKHKSEPSVQELLQRIKQIRGHNFILTLDDPYYTDKAKMFPGSMIAMGADVLISLFDPKWGLDPVKMLDVFAENNIKFLVQGRMVGDTFLKLSDIRNNNKLLQDGKYYKCFAHVEGRTDISSTQLRNK
jgi:hypothetical protein